MNNTDFRRFVLDSSQKSPTSSTSPTSKSRQDATPSSLGSRSRGNIPMTPRTVQGGGGSVDFARQLAEQNNNNEATKAKKFRSTNAPKGVKLGHGYVDRARERQNEQSGQSADDRAARIQALEEQLKLGQIDRETFEKMRDNITGGDITATHLVKGLDRKLLERIRRGEDVTKSPSAAESQSNEPTSTSKEEAEAKPVPDEDELLEEFENKEIVPVQHDQVEKKGEMAPPPMPKPVAGAKRSRDVILAELKASRKAAAEAAAARNTQAEEPQSQLGSRFRKLGESTASGKQPRIERDEKGREVLITYDEHGRMKRKVRKVAQASEPSKNGLLMPDKASQPLGMAVPEGVQKARAESPSDEDDDIFQGVGDTFDPLEALKKKKEDNKEDDSDSSSSDSEGELTQPPEAEVSNQEEKPDTEPHPTKHNYFNEKPSETNTAAPAGLNDPSFLSSLKRAAALAPKSPDDKDEEDSNASDAEERPEKTSKLSETAKRLLQRDRDMDDMDLGFGSSRFGDEDDDEGGGRVKLAQWKGGAGDDDEEDEGRGRGGQKQRKRGKKKKKGDKESAADVMKVLEGRKGK